MTPKKVSELCGTPVNVIVDPAIVYAVEGSCTTPEIEIIQFSSFCGTIAVP
jgi:hypothetical protein